MNDYYEVYPKVHYDAFRDKAYVQLIDQFEVTRSIEPIANLRTLIADPFLSKNLPKSVARCWSYACYDELEYRERWDDIESELDDVK